MSLVKEYEPQHVETNKMICAPSEDSVFAVCMKKLWVYGYPVSTQRRLWSDWADARLVWVFAGPTCHFVGFVVLRLK